MLRQDDLAFDPKRAEAFLTSGLWNDDTLVSWLERHARRTPDKPFIVDGPTSVSYGECLDRAKRLAAGLLSLGLDKGDIVATQLPNGSDYLVSYLAVVLAGGVFQSIHLPYRKKDLEFFLRHSRARMAICLPEVRDFSPAAALLELKGRLMLDRLWPSNVGLP